MWLIVAGATSSVLGEIKTIDGLGEQVKVVSQAVLFGGAEAVIQQQRQRVDEYIVHDGGGPRCGRVGRGGGR